MTKLLLSVHVLAAILAIGPITVAASMFPRYVKPPPEGATAIGTDERDPRTAAFLHRICRGYTVVGIAVPAFGLATGLQMGVLTDAWLLISVVLTALAAALLLMAILPGQERLLGEPAEAGSGAATRSAAVRLAMVTGIFNLLWATVVVLMIVRPGSTTGV
ncbi:hypothetical protein ACFVT5_26070 [Streptomyces sp. NPDC058001]|uniref:hypothetical protein n=1 Tax=Streptomyces sp. NPDC058001 TaxID=3346300 RepID=UPI0036F08FBE